MSCAGITSVSGTGRWKYVETVYDGHPNKTDDVKRVVFARNMNHWDGVPDDSVTFMHLVRYGSAEEVKSALLNNTLDIVVGDGVMRPADIEEFRTQRSQNFSVYLTEPSKIVSSSSTQTKPR